MPSTKKPENTGQPPAIRATYSIHPIYPLVFGLVLILLANGALNEMLDPTYESLAILLFKLFQRAPRAAMWYLVAYGWFLYLTGIYKVEVDEDGNYRLKSLFKKVLLRRADILWVKNGILFVHIYLREEKFSVTKLIDGIGDIASVFPDTPTAFPQLPDYKIPTRVKVLRMIVLIILVALAIYVEIEHRYILQNPEP